VLGGLTRLGVDVGMLDMVAGARDSDVLPPLLFGGV
jgi:hypothetical protein